MIVFDVTNLYKFFDLPNIFLHKIKNPAIAGCLMSLFLIIYQLFLLSICKKIDFIKDSACSSISFK